jgi:hypothetical protein
VALESRAEMAEAEAGAAAEAMAVMTPRPPRPAPAAEQLLGAEGLATLQAAALQHRHANLELLCSALCRFVALVPRPTSLILPDDHHAETTLDHLLLYVNMVHKGMQCDSRAALM